MDIRIAVIDNGVDGSLMSCSMAGKVYIGENFQCLADEAGMGTMPFVHGSTCAAIIKEYFYEAWLYSIRILDDTGKGFVGSLEPALEWCCRESIRIVNLSLGTTHFRDKSAVRTVVNHYANRGMTIIAATANSGYRSYPASFSNVIGVAAGEAFGADAKLQEQKGVDFIAPSDHEIMLGGSAFKTGRSNSYAAPYVTAMVGKLLEKCAHGDVCAVRNELLQGTAGQNYMYIPDWMEIAWVSEQCSRSRAAYYFREAGGSLESCESEVDTIVVCDKEEYEKCRCKGKHMVYLGKEPIEPAVSGRHFWSREQRVRQIFDSRKRTAEIDIPVIVFGLPRKCDEIFWLSELRERFGKDGYNVYTASSRPESVLYDLEFLPEEICGVSGMEQVWDFLYWQTCYCQSDALLLGAAADGADSFAAWEAAADMVIGAKGDVADGGLQIRIYCDGGLKEEKTLKCQECEAVAELYGMMLRLLTEDTDEQ